jgi:hypothetical protein
MRKTGARSRLWSKLSWKGRISDAGTQTELRVLRSRSSAVVGGSANLHVRVHVLRDLCDECVERALPQLQRRSRTKTDPACSCARKVSGVDEARAEGGRLQGPVIEKGRTAGGYLQPGLVTPSPMLLGERIGGCPGRGERPDAEALFWGRTAPALNQIGARTRILKEVKRSSHAPVKQGNRGRPSPVSSRVRFPDSKGKPRNSGRAFLEVHARVFRCRA